LRSLALGLQETAFGGHDPKTLKLLDAHARGQGGDPMFLRLQSGTVLIREYRGVRHSAIIANDGFIWQEKSYPNLSVIARAIVEHGFDQRENKASANLTSTIIAAHQ
jgi:Protein of unknown function (DUF2924)